MKIRVISGKFFALNKERSTSVIYSSWLLHLYSFFRKTNHTNCSININLICANSPA